MRRWIWFAILYVAGVVALGSIGLLVRMVLIK